jgi:hypothetical protein
MFGWKVKYFLQGVLQHESFTINQEALRKMQGCKAQRQIVHHLRKS